MATYTLAGTAKERGLSRVNSRLVQVIEAAAARSPYQVQIFSGKRTGSAGGSRHNTGNALDIALIDPTTGQVIPNYKSSTGFPIYAEFAKIAREEQMRLAPDLADSFRWGGGFSDKDFDLMHFDVKPGGSMAYWTWQDGGKLTEAGAAAVPKFGPGWVYANGQRYRAPEGQYASLWGNAPYQGPQDAQSAIADLVAPAGGTLAPTPPPAVQAYAPYLPDATAVPPPASASPDFDFAAGPGPTFTLPPISRSPGPGGALGVDLGMQPAGMPVPPSRPGTFDWLGGGAPDAGLVPTPGISPLRPAIGGPGDRRPQPPTPSPRPWQGPMPPMRPGNFDWLGGGAPGAPPDPRMRPSGPQSPVDAFSPPEPAIPWQQRMLQPGPVIPRTSLEKAEQDYYRPGEALLAGGNLGMPETQMSLERTFSPTPPSNLPGRFDDAFAPGPTFSPPPTDIALPNTEPVSGAPGFDTGRFDDAIPTIPPIPGTTFLPPGTDPYNIPPPMDIRPPAQVASEQTVNPAAAAANQPNIPQPPAVAAAAPQDPQAVQQEEQGQRGWLARVLGIGQGGGPGGFRSLPGFGSILNPNGFLNNMGTSPAFTPFGAPRMDTGFGGSLRTSGKTPSGTPWSTGTSNALGGSNALQWTGSGGQTITAYTDPTTGQTFHSFG